MKKFKHLAVIFSAVLLALAMFGCGDSTTTVNYDGTYRCYDEGTYLFLVIRTDSMTAYMSDTEDFADAIRLNDGEYTLTVRDDEGITAVNDTFGTQWVYTSDGAGSLTCDDLSRTYVKI